MPQQNAKSTAGPHAEKLYKDLLVAVRSFGGFEQEMKKTSIHLVRETAFAGVQFRKQHLVLTIKSDRPLQSPRIHKSEQTSKNRWHVEVKVADAKELDRELLGWIKSAYALCGARDVN